MITPSKTSQQIIVRSVLFDDLNQSRHTGIMLGNIVIVHPQQIEGEIARRIRNEGDKRVLDHYQGFI